MVLKIMIEVHICMFPNHFCYSNVQKHLDLFIDLLDEYKGTKISIILRNTMYRP